jgi:crotonobetainyl-CoA:carnitine CoA-transferase CaiB-like acyl-CoA transferase
MHLERFPSKDHVLTPQSSAALSGIRVLDFSRVLAGPFCTMMLGDLGADVIKVENPFRGDDTRQWGPPWSGEQSAYFLSVNRNKRSLTLNLKTASGQDIARRLAALSHIVVENFKPGEMTRFGLGYDDLRALNPALVFCSITGFGQTGPYRDQPGYDYAIQAISGLMSITGEPDGQPMKVGVAISDVLTGLFAVSSILAALRHAESIGTGQHIDVSLLDSQIAALVNVASSYLVSAQAPARLGNEHPNIVPYQTFRAADHDFVLAVGNDRQFTQLCARIQQPNLATDPRFNTNPARVANRAALVSELQAVFIQRPSDDWVRDLLAVGIPAAPINDLPTILNDPHVHARGLLHGAFIGPPVQFSATPTEVRLPPPALGQHTNSLLRELLAIDDDTLAAYHAQQVI